MTVQLRLYTINRGCLRQFAEEWKANVLPLRLEHGFRVHGAWIIEETNQFAWLIGYDGPESSGRPRKAPTTHPGSARPWRRTRPG